MSDNSTRRQFIAATGSVAAVALAGCSEGESGTGTEEMTESMTESMTEGEQMASQATFTVRIENVAPPDFYGSDTSTGGAVWLTPGAYAVHTGHNPIYTEGEPASVGLEALAESGHASGFDGENGLIDELGGMSDGEMSDGEMTEGGMTESEMDDGEMTEGGMTESEMSDDGMGNGVAHAGTFTPDDTVEDPNDPMGEVPGAPPIAPGGAFEFEITAEPGQRFSFASMFVPSNDLFYSPDSSGITLWPEDGDPVSGDVTDDVLLLDAGTEPNQPPGEGPDQAPAQDSFDQGDDEDGVVRPIADVDDGYNYPDVSDVIRVTLTPQDAMGDDSMTEESMDDSMTEESMDDSMTEESMDDSMTESMDDSMTESMDDSMTESMNESMTESTDDS